MNRTTYSTAGSIGRSCRSRGLVRRSVVRAWLGLLAGLSAGLLSHMDPLLAQTEATLGHAAFFGGGGSGHQQGAFTAELNLNSFLGADRFYDAGLTGAHVVIANIEAGVAWSGHESLQHAQLIPTSGALGEADRHATWVAMLMAGRTNSDDPGEYQRGLAPDAAFFSGAVATSWGGTRYSTSFNLNFTSNSTYGPYRAAFQTGISGSGNSRTADVINSSWNTSGSGSTTGTNRLSGVLDALASSNPRTLMTASAGNTTSGPTTPNRVISPATAFNNIAVGALGTLSTEYDAPSFFTNGGPNDYSDPVSGTIRNIRQAIDIAAPAENIATAYYGGETGGNRPSIGGAADDPAGGPDWYSRSVRGSSFSAPIVAGGASLLYDAAYAHFAHNPDARDARVIKAVLMNSADKTSGWDNGQVPHPNGNGGVLTEQALDDLVGTGRINLDRAFDQFLTGTNDVPPHPQEGASVVNHVGWDFSDVAEGVTNDYLFDQALAGGSTFNATLTWFRDRRQSGTTNFTEESYDNLDLELWLTTDGMPLALVSESRSMYNNSEHFSFSIPSTAQYMLRVRWTSEIFDLVNDVNSETYGLAWMGRAIPEPGTLTLGLLALVASCGCVRRERRSGSHCSLGSRVGKSKLALSCWPAWT